MSQTIYAYRSAKDFVYTSDNRRHTFVGMVKTMGEEEYFRQKKELEEAIKERRALKPMDEDALLMYEDKVIYLVTTEDYSWYIDSEQDYLYDNSKQEKIPIIVLKRQL